MSDQEFDQQAENVEALPVQAEEAPVSPEESEPAVEAAAEASAEPQAAQSDADQSGMDWFIIHTYSGFENKVAESLRARASAYGFQDRLGQVLIPTEEVVELRNGKKVTSKRLLYPGYVLVEMEMDDELWHAVKSTPRVTGFVGGGTKPVPLTADEINSVLSSGQLQQIAAKLGVSVDQVPHLLAAHLPSAVDQASPNGVLATQ